MSPDTPAGALSPITFFLRRLIDKPPFFQSYRL
jgi:hypothetical protein